MIKHFYRFDTCKIHDKHMANNDLWEKIEITKYEDTRTAAINQDLEII